MTGPEHYSEAEYLMAQSVHLRAQLLDGDPAVSPEEPARVVALAQVHATLALAAATICMPSNRVPLSHATYRAWDVLVQRKGD